MCSLSRRLYLLVLLESSWMQLVVVGRARFWWRFGCWNEELSSLAFVYYSESAGLLVEVPNNMCYLLSYV